MVPDTENQFQYFGCLQQTHHSRQDSQDSGLTTARRHARGRGLREDALITRALAGHEGRELSIKAQNAGGNVWLAQLHRYLVEEVSRIEVVSAVDDDVVRGDDPLGILRVQ